MKKELFNKKLHLFRKLGYEVKESKKGNYYIIIPSGHADKGISYERYTPTTVTKNTISKMYTNKFIKKVDYDIILILSKTGVLYYRNPFNRNTKNQNFKRINAKSRIFSGGIRAVESIMSNILHIAYLDKPYEWIKNYPRMSYFNLAFQFNSLEEFRTFLRFDYTDDFTFSGVFNNYAALMIESYNFHPSIGKAITFNHTDYDTMCIIKDIITQLYKTENKQMEIPTDKLGLKRFKDIFCDKDSNKYEF